MFGYVKTDIPNLYVKDTVLYRSFYCGLCKSIGKCCGNCGRLVLNYDLAFLSAFTHNVAGIDVVIERKRCIIHWLKRRPIVKTDELSDRIGSLNVILAYYKLTDDNLDEKKGFFKRAFFKKSYKRAVKKEPILDEIVSKSYSELVDYEKTKGDSTDIAADSFGKMMQAVVKELLSDKCTKDIESVSYNLGKWVYLIDALDDFDKDKKTSSYNVFAISDSLSQNKSEFIEKNRSELEFIFSTILSDITDCNSRIDYKFNHDLIDNVLNCGLKQQTKNIMENKKCKKITKS